MSGKESLSELNTTIEMEAINKKCRSTEFWDTHEQYKVLRNGTLANSYRPEKYPIERRDLLNDTLDTLERLDDISLSAEPESEQRVKRSLFITLAVFTLITAIFIGALTVYAFSIRSSVAPSSPKPSKTTNQPATTQTQETPPQSTPDNSQNYNQNSNTSPLSPQQTPSPNGSTAPTPNNSLPSSPNQNQNSTPSTTTPNTPEKTPNSSVPNKDSQANEEKDESKKPNSPNSGSDKSN